MGIIISFCLVVFFGAALIAAIDRLAQRGRLDSGTRWFQQGPSWIIVAQFCSLVILWILKAFEVGFERTGSPAFVPWCGLVRRLDDLSWWTMIMGTVVGTTMIWYSGRLVFSGTVGRRARLVWRVMAPVGLTFYAVAVAIGDGTFFWTGSSSFVARLQIVEGGIVMAYILTSYLFISTLVDVVIAGRPRARAITISVLIGGVLGLIGIASALTGAVGDRWAACGFKQQPNYANWRFWVFAALVWWPWLVVYLVSLFAGGRRSAPSTP